MSLDAPIPQSPAVYLVGGAVRDALLGRAVSDRDYVVVGVSPEQMLAEGFLPVGKDFPVFLHPQTHDEVALARLERKTAAGYRGFSVQFDATVSIEDDLSRRDLTINSIALKLMNSETKGEFSVKKMIVEASRINWAAAMVNALADGDAPVLVDPFGGLQDLASKTLRHVTAAFAEDPVRILRVARFAARLTGFEVAPDTVQLMRGMVDAGEVNALVPERVWQELSRGLMADEPSKMLTVLRSCGALAVLLPEVNALWGVPQPIEHHPEVDTGVHLCLVLDEAARANAGLAVRFAALCHDLGKATTHAHLLPKHHGHGERSVKLLQRICDRLKVPLECRELAEIVAQEHGNVHGCMSLNAAATVRLMQRCDAFRRPTRFEQALLACECDARGRAGLSERPYPQRDRLLKALLAGLSIDSKTIATNAMNPVTKGQNAIKIDENDADKAKSARLTGERIKRAIAAARVDAVAAAFERAGLAA